MPWAYTTFVRGGSNPRGLAYKQNKKNNLNILKRASVVFDQNAFFIYWFLMKLENIIMNQIHFILNWRADCIWKGLQSEVIFLFTGKWVYNRGGLINGSLRYAYSYVLIFLRYIISLFVYFFNLSILLFRF